MQQRAQHEVVLADETVHDMRQRVAEQHPPHLGVRRAEVLLHVPRLRKRLHGVDQHHAGRVQLEHFLGDGRTEIRPQAGQHRGLSGVGPLGVSEGGAGRSHGAGPGHTRATEWHAGKRGAQLSRSGDRPPREPPGGVATRCCRPDGHLVYGVVDVQHRRTGRVEQPAPVTECVRGGSAGLMQRTTPERDKSAQKGAAGDSGRRKRAQRAHAVRPQGAGDPRDEPDPRYGGGDAERHTPIGARQIGVGGRGVGMLPVAPLPPQRRQPRMRAVPRETPADRVHEVRGLLRAKHGERGGNTQRAIPVGPEVAAANARQHLIAQFAHGLNHAVRPERPKSERRGHLGDQCLGDRCARVVVVDGQQHRPGTIQAIGAGSLRAERKVLTLRLQTGRVQGHFAVMVGIAERLSERGGATATAGRDGRGQHELVHV